MNNQDNQNQISLEDLQMMNNEIVKLDRVIESKTIQIEQLLKIKSRNLDWKASASKPKRYSIEFTINPQDNSSRLNQQVNSFIVDKGTIFRPESLDSSLKASLFTEAGSPVSSLTNLTLPYGDSIDPAGIVPFRNSFFTALIEISDSGSDREWQNAPFPDVWLASGLVAPFYLGENAVIMEGTEVFVRLTPLSLSTNTALPSNIIQYNFQIGFSGHEQYIK